MTPFDDHNDKLFISYSRNDRIVVEAILKILNDKGYPVWIDQNDISVGQDIVGRINTGIEEAKVFIAFAGKHYFTDDRFTSAEFGAAFYKAMSVPRWKIIVVTLDSEVRLPPLVASRLYIKHTSPEATAEAIAQAIRRTEVWEQVPTALGVADPNAKRATPVNLNEMSDLDLELVTNYFLENYLNNLRKGGKDASFEIPLTGGRRLAFTVLTAVLSSSVILSIRGLRDGIDVAARFVAHYSAEIDEGLLGRFAVATQIQLEKQQKKLTENRNALRAQFEAIAENPTLLSSGL
ncbi:MAG: toll/interleukin-1 receptor domain-containing protein [Alphaproteobacteria bacterium]|nr:toll/interleukin-1 receptor domain-containing protein [Alphaproteobacteria bacterium]MBU1549657.1 toll/interleukin-1 receptor domain-containing protein [Alphaproteobacteria bacterium]MBU2336512.1 toll/interleukin-1 receptor domain-containing protein [Alphaproteobacteria bacterium]MBU2387607.1 toll/interleukin-1 receptor domain-containing protein [Alphaproteobacteria bacterium]|tara:strand:- start:134 stop:1009 length:876 start_codon:yes stop_codon:yes gene_type:complete